MMCTWVPEIMDYSHFTFYSFFCLTTHLFKGKNVCTTLFMRDCPHLSFYFYNGLGQFNKKFVYDNQVTSSTLTSLIAY